MGPIYHILSFFLKKFKVRKDVAIFHLFSFLHKFKDSILEIIVYLSVVLREMNFNLKNLIIRESLLA